MLELIDLDILKPEQQKIRLAGKEIDISFIPSGIALKALEMQEELRDVQKKDVANDAEASKKAFDISAEICGLICQAQNTEMTKEWLLKNNLTKIPPEEVILSIFNMIS